jgi:polysaccharide biosynthesis/export protein
MALALAPTLTGCASHQKELRQLYKDRQASGLVPPSHHEDEYAPAYPDRLKLEFTTHPQWNGLYPITVDGRIALAGYAILIENLPIGQLRISLADFLKISPEEMKITVAQHYSRVVIVHGAITGGTRHVDYQGPESVMDVLSRMGGLSEDADLRRISLVRSNIAQGTKQQIFDINLEKLLKTGELEENLTIQPNDEIYIAENRRANLAKILPPFMMPVYNKLRGWIPGLARNTQPEAKAGVDPEKPEGMIPEKIR